MRIGHCLYDPGLYFLVFIAYILLFFHPIYLWVTPALNSWRCVLRDIQRGLKKSVYYLFIGRLDFSILDAWFTNFGLSMHVWPFSQKPLSVLVFNAIFMGVHRGCNHIKFFLMLFSVPTFIPYLHHSFNAAHQVFLILSQHYYFSQIIIYIYWYH